MKILFITLAFTLATSAFAQTTPVTALSLIDVNSQLIKELTKIEFAPVKMINGKEHGSCAKINGVQFIQELADPAKSPDLLDAVAYACKWHMRFTYPAIRAALLKAQNSALEIGTPDALRYAMFGTGPILKMFTSLDKNPSNISADWSSDAKLLASYLR